MTQTARAEPPASPLVADLLPQAAAAAEAAAALVAAARGGLAARVSPSGRPSAAALETEQTAAHGLAWMATYAEGLRQMSAWAQALDAQGRFGEIERLILQIACGEYLAQLAGGIPMSQTEIVRPGDLGLPAPALAAFRTPEVETLIAHGNTDAARARLVALMLEGQGVASFGATGLGEDDEMIRDQFRRFADDRIVPHAHGWHLRDELIPIEIVEEMGALGVFGLTIPEEYGGAGMSKTAMCVVSEELSRGLHRRRLARHPLGDRGGTDPRRRHRGAEAQPGCRASPPPRCCPLRSSPSPTPAPTSAPCAPGQCATATPTP